MATINEKLLSILNSKDAIKAAIIAKGGTCSDKLSEFANAVAGIPSGGETIEEVTIVYDLQEKRITEIASWPASWNNLISGEGVLSFPFKYYITTETLYTYLSYGNLESLVIETEHYNIQAIFAPAFADYMLRFYDYDTNTWSEWRRDG